MNFGPAGARKHEESLKRREINLRQWNPTATGIHASSLTDGHQLTLRGSCTAPEFQSTHGWPSNSHQMRNNACFEAQILGLYVREQSGAKHGIQVSASTPRRSRSAQTTDRVTLEELSLSIFKNSKITSSQWGEKNRSRVSYITFTLSSSTSVDTSHSPNGLFVPMNDR